MPKVKPLTQIARDAKRKAVKRVMRRFSDDRARTAAHFGMTPQAIGQILARK